MRTTLVRWLDELGLHHHLGLPSSAELFTTDDHLLHATSAVRHPVFRDGRNGAGKFRQRRGFLRDQIDHWFA